MINYTNRPHRFLIFWLQFLVFWWKQVSKKWFPISYYPLSAWIWTKSFVTIFQIYSASISLHSQTYKISNTLLFQRPSSSTQTNQFLSRRMNEISPPMLQTTLLYSFRTVSKVCSTLHCKLKSFLNLPKGINRGIPLLF